MVFTVDINLNVSKILILIKVLGIIKKKCE